jgi:hypothetical protein
MALVNSAVLACSIKGSTGLTVEIHDDDTVKFTDPETGVAKSFSMLNVANLSKFFIAVRETGNPRLSGVTFT